MQVKRDINILKAYQKQLNLSTKAIKDKSKYTRKHKHKGAHNETSTQK